MKLRSREANKEAKNKKFNQSNHHHSPSKHRLSTPSTTGNVVRGRTFNNIMKNSPNTGGPPVPIPTNRQLTVSLIGSIIRFAIDVPQVVRRREKLLPDKLLFLLLPIVRNLGKLIDRIRHSSSVAGRNASNGSGRFAPSRGDQHSPHAPTAAGTSNQVPAKCSDKYGTASSAAQEAKTPTNAMWQPATQQRVSNERLNLQRQRQQQQQQCPGSMTSMLMSDEEDDESYVAFEMHRESLGLRAGPAVRRQVLRQKDGNYAIRETTDTRGADGTFQRITKTISGPDVMILTNITSQLSELSTLMPRATGRDSARPAEK
ncbi:uncharacterized protein LOC118509737 [Anopheles stephensi]|uniref:uncharacterized protein LOC118509737 n=1 Tax=Anopheles stephensi TaxID=30069 RepID=UPI0016589402|nr:uncharacterized protein LOC118509737 [Anopheles stephensi]